MTIDVISTEGPGQRHGLGTEARVSKCADTSSFGVIGRSNVNVRNLFPGSPQGLDYYEWTLLAWTAAKGLSGGTTVTRFMVSLIVY
jgi:hypothetical protein